MYEIVLTAWMYLTPIIYPEETIPESFRWWLFNLNPVYHLIKLFRLPLYDAVWPSLLNIGVAVVVAGLALIVGWAVFTRKADELAYRV
jgi:ABC-type polysaccharide/polyol phosphate export permease